MSERTKCRYCLRPARKATTQLDDARGLCGRHANAWAQWWRLPWRHDGEMPVPFVEFAAKRVRTVEEET